MPEARLTGPLGSLYEPTGDGVRYRFKNAVKFVVKIQIQTDYLASDGSVFLGRKLVIFPSVQNTRTIAIRANPAA